MPGHAWDLEERTATFALAVRALARRLPTSTANLEDSKQLIRSSGSVAANYIEANEALGNKDRVMKLRISRKEAKESQLWLRLLHLGADAEHEQERDRLRQEAHELKLIFTSIIKKLELPAFLVLGSGLLLPPFVWHLATGIWRFLSCQPLPVPDNQSPP